MFSSRNVEKKNVTNNTPSIVQYSQRYGLLSLKTPSIQPKSIESFSSVLEKLGTTFDLSGLGKIGNYSKRQYFLSANTELRSIKSGRKRVVSVR